MSIEYEQQRYHVAKRYSDGVAKVGGVPYLIPPTNDITFSKTYKAF